MKVKKYTDKEIAIAVNKAKKEAKLEYPIDQLMKTHSKESFTSTTLKWLQSDPDLFFEDQIEIPIDKLVELILAKKKEGATHICLDINENYGERDVQFDFLIKSEFTDEDWIKNLEKLQSDKINQAAYNKRTEMGNHNNKIDDYLKMKAEFES